MDILIKIPFISNAGKYLLLEIHNYIFNFHIEFEQKKSSYDLYIVSKLDSRNGTFRDTSSMFSAQGVLRKCRCRINKLIISSSPLTTSYWCPRGWIPCARVQKGRLTWIHKTKLKSDLIVILESSERTFGMFYLNSKETCREGGVGNSSGQMFDMRNWTWFNLLYQQSDCYF